MGGRGKKAGGGAAAAGAPAGAGPATGPTAAEKAAAEDAALRASIDAESELQNVKNASSFINAAEDAVAEQVRRAQGANGNTRDAAEKSARSTIDNAQTIRDNAVRAATQAEAAAKRAADAAQVAGTAAATRNAERARIAAAQTRGVDFQDRITRMRNRYDNLVKANRDWRELRARGPAPRSTAPRPSVAAERARRNR